MKILSACTAASMTNDFAPKAAYMQGTTCHLAVAISPLKFDTHAIASRGFNGGGGDGSIYLH